MCSDDAICALDRTGTMEDSSTPEPDSGEPDSGELDDGGGIELPRVPVEVACAGGGELSGDGFEIVASGAFQEGFVVASDGAMYVTYDSNGGTSVAKIEDGELQPLLDQLTTVQRLVLAGDALFVGLSDGSEVRTAEIDRVSEDVTYLASEAASNAYGIAADSESVYWMADVSQDPWLGRLFRSPRAPGESQVLADFESQPGTDLVRIGDRLFLIAVAGAAARLHSVSTSGARFGPSRSRSPNMAPRGRVRGRVCQLASPQTKHVTQ